jgi:hypothetical protein
MWIFEILVVLAIVAGVLSRRAKAGRRRAGELNAARRLGTCVC